MTLQAKGVPPVRHADGHIAASIDGANRCALESSRLSVPYRVGPDQKEHMGRQVGEWNWDICSNGTFKRVAWEANRPVMEMRSKGSHRSAGPGA